VTVRRSSPVVTLLLIAGNILAAFALLFNPELAFAFGFRPDHPSLAGAISCLFLHSNVVHLLGNMVFLAAVGVAVELAAGAFRFAVVYFVSGLAGVLFHFVLTRSLPDPAPFIGASGAIAGCVAYYSLRYPSLRVSIAPNLQVPVIGVTGVWLALQIVGAFIRIGEGSGVSFWAHLGGFLAGAALIPIFRAPEAAEVRKAHATLEAMSGRSPGAGRAAALRHLEEFPDDPKALEQLAHASEKMGNEETEVRALVKLIDFAKGDSFFDILQRLADLNKLGTVDGWRRLRWADELRSVRPNLACVLFESIVAEPESERRPEALLALAGLVRDNDPLWAKALVAELCRTYPLDPAAEVAKKRGWLA
jgi:membrane associated rhomboid family serine protease